MARSWELPPTQHKVSARKHESIWWSRASRETIQGGLLNRDVDVAVVGGGITGVVTAFLLKEAGQKVALITDRRIGEGVTGHSTGHLTVVSDTNFKDLISKFGTEKIERLVRASDYAIALIEKIASQLKVLNAIGFERVPGFKFIEREDMRTALEEEFDAVRDIGLEAELVAKAPLPFLSLGAIRFEGQALFDPLRFVHELAKTIPGEGSFVAEGLHVTGLREEKPCVLLTDKGEFRAREVVLATHSPIGLYLSLHTRVAPYFSYVTAVKLKKPAAPGLYWDMNDPYRYLRPLSSASSDLWIVGGFDNKTGQESDPDERYQQLQEYVLSRFEVESFENMWGDEVFESVDDLPFIGLIPGSSHVYTATGFSGTGLSWGALAAQLISDAILERENAWASMFSPSRIDALNSFFRFVSENANVAKEMVSGWLASYPHEEIGRIPKEHGEVIEIEGKKIAVHKDRDGRLYFFDPVCPHMRGIVRWNASEKTWDCPLHGSRYTARGAVLNGPSLEGLARLADLPLELRARSKASSAEPEALVSGPELVPET
jgi:glycine/D-amino acid oxidase-like deaminating enzyme/nitrite reductase/ring-hydroxylating ferredoxin subunit